jgi:N,N'-diacetyllegionaminate synthase
MKKINIIAEIGQAHDGSLGIAHSYIDAVKKAGVNTVKFQTHIAKAETTIHEPWRVKFSYEDSTRFDYWKRMEFSEDQWKGIKDHCDNIGINFMSSPFSIEAVELLKRIGVNSWKIASGEINNDEMFDAIAETKKHIYLSTGMSTIKDIDRSVKKIKSKDLPFTILQCTSIYPTPLEKVGLNMIEYFKERYNSNVGLSDHSGIIQPGLAASSIGIKALEIHATFSKKIFGPDTSSSLDIEQITELVEGIRIIEKLFNHSVDKNEIAKELEPMRKIFNKSVVYKKDLSSGSTLIKSDLSVKKPGIGIPSNEIKNIIGKKLLKSVKEDDIVSFSDFD